MVVAVLAASAVFILFAGVASAEKHPGKSGAAGDRVTIRADKTSLNNGGVITVTGTAPAGRSVYIEVWSDKTVRASRFDADVDEQTGKRPYRLYLTTQMPAYYKIFLPETMKDKIGSEKTEGATWKLSRLLKETGAYRSCTLPEQRKVDCYQATFLGSIVGSRGTLLGSMTDRENKTRFLQLVKARFRSLDKVIAADVQIQPDGAFRAEIPVRSGLAPGAYRIAAYADGNIRSDTLTFENRIGFPLVYLPNAGTSLNVFGPFLLALGIVIFGVLMGAGGGFILNPLLVSIWPLPHTIVAGTVMPTVLFSQGSGIYNYSKIKFISWKLGATIGLSMVAGGFIGPKLTELITLSQFKYVFGWILLVLAALMLWQTTPGYLAKNKKEQAILKEFKKKAQDAAASRRQAGTA
jgi:hypothetical protein